MLFEPLTLRSLMIPNRIWMAPMCQYSAAPDGPAAGVANDWHFAHLAARAVGGAGLILVEATAVSPEGRISPADLGLWNERQEKELARITEFLSDQGTVPAIQLAHAGRKASTDRPWRGGGPVDRVNGGWQPLAPSPVPFTEGHPMPDELTTTEIRRIVDDFATAAQRALRAGFQVVEVHGAHGYLIGQFLSPHSNHRTDGYGGTFENRIRFPLEVVDAVRAAWPDDLPVFFRISATDWLPEDRGWTLDDTVRFAKELLARGVDLLDTSSGGNAANAKVHTGPGYQVPFAARVRAETDLPVAAVGEITDPHQAATILATGQADAVLLGRELLRNPYWPHQAAHTLGVPARWPDQYRRAV
ncbi:NADH:flavin oxidoreductase/NADH oxidase [Micromonospora andamanensis]|uniref:NADH:flavin oxidoreductase/NADH oxidase n=1 Tax=Micromonospora andamanensis TaxID=1287068 RepID=UPI001A3A7AD8|nr:NADH:flavin oxidoreductase/NADH oxidase [Micromonospora andamanensis]GIJ42976.1 oxidoreductase [Micromonospora andamanensis]